MQQTEVSNLIVPNSFLIKNYVYVHRQIRWHDWWKRLGASERAKEAKQNKLRVNIVWKNRINFQCGWRKRNKSLIWKECV